LTVVAQRLALAVAATDSVARLGGDEFAVIARNEDVPGAQNMAKRIARVLAAPATIDDQPLEVSASIGVAVYPEDGRDYATVMRHADVAMYDAKRRSELVARYEAESDPNSPMRLRLLADLRQALEDPAHAAEITFHYQPHVRISTGDVVDVEALLRWKS
jgi:predicted signal transduction protein with EAL and GGDEF domain